MRSLRVLFASYFLRRKNEMLGEIVLDASKPSWLVCALIFMNFLDLTNKQDVVLVPCGRTYHHSRAPSLQHLALQLICLNTVVFTAAEEGGLCGFFPSF